MFDHWHWFSEFARLELNYGGPDPHLPTVAAMSKSVSKQELIWRGGLLLNAWNVPTAEIIWNEWPIQKVYGNEDKLTTWVIDNWGKFPTRIERRCVRTPTNFNRYLLSYANWISKPLAIKGSYEELWVECQKNVDFMGRYIALKLLEYFNRYCDISAKVPDIRAKGGWSPVRTLQILYPDIDITTVELAEFAARKAKSELEHRLNKTVSFFELQVLLCEYREAYESKRQYPGRSLDSELTWLKQVQELWHNQTEMLIARNCFPEQHRGEIRGWDGVRKELGTCLREYGYLWSDMLYDYTKTENIATPVAYP